MNKQISNIVFTKNRPLQLDGYLESLYKQFPVDLIQTYILYKPELFDDQYRQLFEKYSDSVVIREKDFSTDFLRILNDIHTRYILFGVDDVIYFDSVDLELIDETFNSFVDNIFGFSLRFDEQNIKKSDPVSQSNVAGQTIYGINWPDGRTPTTRYPFELCATIYKTELIKKIVSNSRSSKRLCEDLFAPNSRVVNRLGRIFRKHSILKKFGYFYNPNTLESWNCRWCQNNPSQLPSSLYFQKICASAIQVNMVNTSTNNQNDNSAEHTVEALNEKYKQGYRFDMDYIARNKPTKTHCGQKFFVVIR